MTNQDSIGTPLPPERIRDAIVRVTDPAFPIPLSPAVKLALTFLLRRVEVSNGMAEFWVKRMNFAQVVDRCDKTISNWLNELEATGLIVKEQTRTNWGAFRCLTVRLTALAVELLDLTGLRVKRGSTRKISSHVQDTFIQSKETTYGPSANAEVTTKNTELPEDLRALVCDQLPKTAVFKLMGMATRAGTRLSHIVAVSMQNIQKADHRFAYLKKLINQKKDWNFIAEKLQSEVKAIVEEDNTLQLRRKAWEKLQGTTLPFGSGYVVVGQPFEACQMYSKEFDGAHKYKGVLAGAALLRLIDAKAKELFCAEQASAVEKTKQQEVPNTAQGLTKPIHKTLWNEVPSPFLQTI